MAPFIAPKGGAPKRARRHGVPNKESPGGPIKIVRVLSAPTDALAKEQGVPKAEGAETVESLGEPKWERAMTSGDIVGEGTPHDGVREARAR